MAEGQGGPRTPRNPAPVSAPGSMSRRTDGQVMPQMTGMPYGENSDFNEMQSSAPMSATNMQGPRLKGKSAPPAGMGGGSSSTPLFSDTQRPDEPVTAGAPFGPGSGSQSIMGSVEQSRSDASAIKKYLPDLIRMAESEDSLDGFKRFVRHLRNVQGS